MRGFRHFLQANPFLSYIDKVPGSILGTFTLFSPFPLSKTGISTLEYGTTDLSQEPR
jgi:hypothetical protein